MGILLKTSEIARISDGEVIVLHDVNDEENPTIKQEIETKTNQILKDISHRLIIPPGMVTE